MLILRHNELSADDLFLIERKMVKLADPEQPFDWSLHDDLLSKSRPEVYGSIIGLLKRTGFCSSLGITTSEFLDFLIDVDHGYEDNPYHSFYHAADVAMVLYHMLKDYDVSDYLSSIDMAALMIAALCHDIGHPGMNNNYQVNMNTELSQRYHNLSVLESYSCSIAMDLLTKHQLLYNVEEIGKEHGIPTSEEKIRKFIVKAILATDMICHYQLQANLNGLLEFISAEDSHKVLPTVTDLFSTRGQDSPLIYFEEHYFSESSTCCSRSRPKSACEFLPAEETVESAAFVSPKYPLTEGQRQALCEILLHAADISNAVRPWDICLKWSNLVCIEFFRQGEAEKQAGLPVSPNMDRHQVNQATIGAQFSDFIVRPYFELFVSLFPKAKELLVNLQDNRKRWAMEGSDAEEEEDESGEEIEVPSTHDEEKRLGDHPPFLGFPTAAFNPGRRLSAAAGTIVLPSRASRRPFINMRSSSHSSLEKWGNLSSNNEESVEVKNRRKSEQDEFYRNSTSSIESSPPRRVVNNLFVS
ncbi:uncharacterized protein BYT42DRAFT_556802 [Radiomyces spectabilis]|uniref:uncharacterized protein n=1 Tax=Radiomyces spectabilis TaxID=64574 RepID=UPI0022208932|nr:uncharacterized protein BYT42DRAFT_556802 [Radiomyces spectabilis]KAI8391416.1 hypothetical protein BYT42DRAFT_556802 [Radiomyces spectabilis]